jgi:hypothetical protein
LPELILEHPAALLRAIPKPRRFSHPAPFLFLLEQSVLRRCWLAAVVVVEVQLLKRAAAVLVALMYLKYQSRDHL